MAWSSKPSNKVSWNNNKVGGKAWDALFDYNFSFIQGASFVATYSAEEVQQKHEAWGNEVTSSTQWLNKYASKYTFVYLQGASFIVMMEDYGVKDTNQCWQADDVPKNDWCANSNTKEQWEPEAVDPVPWANLIKAHPDWEATSYLWIEKGEDFLTGTLALLTLRTNNNLGFPEDFSFCAGPATEGDTSEVDSFGMIHFKARLWIVFKSNDGKLYLAKSNDDFTEFEFIKELIYVPSGAENLCIRFDKTGHYAISFQLYAAGQSERQLWVYRYPYSGASVTKIVEGNQFESSVMFMDHSGDLLYFYLDNTDVTNTKVYYRFGTDNFATSYELPIPVGGVKKLLSCLFYAEPKLDKPDFYLKATVLYNIAQETRVFRYINTSVLATSPYRLAESIGDRISMGVSAFIRWVAVTFNHYTHEDSLIHSIALRSILWVAVTFDKYQMVDTHSVSTALNDIRWVCITRAQKDINETHNMTVGLQSILWIQVNV
jgi:hypothetical protein